MGAAHVVVVTAACSSNSTSHAKTGYDAGSFLYAAGSKALRGPRLQLACDSRGRDRPAAAPPRGGRDLQPGRPLPPRLVRTRPARVRTRLARTLVALLWRLEPQSCLSSRVSPRRCRLRDAFRRFDPPNIVQRYVVGCTMRNASALQVEAEQHGDVIVTAHPDENGAACIEKSFSWWSLALHAFPRARFLAKTDDDSLNNFANLAAILTNPSLVSRGPGRQEQLLYGGWPQFTSYLPEYNVGCGWAGDAGGAIGNARTSTLGGVNTNCRFCVNHPFCYHPSGSSGIRSDGSSGAPFNDTALRGPYVFATGALQLMSAPLA